MILSIHGWFGRLGNNIIQVANALYVAYYYNYNIKLPTHSYFNKTYIELNPSLKFQQCPEYVDCHGPYFFDYKRIQEFPQDCFTNNHDKVRKALLDLFVIDAKTLEPLTADDVVIHVRSGDIFASVINFMYITPPLSFYTDILNRTNYKKIYLVAEDTANPCINELINRYPNIIYTKNTLDEDIKLILRAQNIIWSFGTFATMLLCLTDHTKTIYTMSHNFHNYGDHVFSNLNVNFHIVDSSEYISKMGSKWRNSAEQKQIMLSF